MPGNDLYSTDCRAECQSERNVAAMGAGLVCDIRICLDLRAGPDLRCAHLIRIGGKGESQDVVTFFLLYYQEAARRWESMIPTLQIYLPIALCQLSDYNRALKLLACMQKGRKKKPIIWYGRQKPSGRQNSGTH